MHPFEHISLHPPASITKRFFYETAPVREAVKPAILFNIKRRDFDAWERLKLQIRPAYALSQLELCSCASYKSCLIFNQHLLGKQLESPVLKQTLHQWGYPADTDTNALLAQLQKRYSQKEKGYPHEIGLFLGYPLADVLGFIQFKGKNFKLCRYWKVYGDVDKSRRNFQAIDFARAKAAKELLLLSEAQLT